MSYIYINQVI